MFPNTPPGRVMLLILLVGLLYACSLILAPFWSELFMAMILAVVFYPLQNALHRRTGRRRLSVWLVTIGVGVLFLFPLSLFSIVLVREANHAYQLFSHWVGPSGGLDNWHALLDRLGALVGIEREQLDALLWGKLEGLAGGAVNNALESLQGIGSWVASSFITLITFFFLLDGGPQIIAGLKAWLPLPDNMVDQLLVDVERMIFANVYGVLSVALAQGFLLAMGFWALGLPAPALWGTVTAMLSVIPMLGAGLVWVPATLYLLSTGALGKAAILAAWGGLVVSMADNVIRPIILGERSHIHTGVMFFALLGGIQAFGLIGLFAGPIFFSLSIAVLRLLRQENEKMIHTDGVS